MASSGFSRPVHTEHVLFECVVSASNAPDVRLFRAPTVHNASGTHKRLPHEVTWDDLRQEDLILALQIEELGNGIRIVSILQFWHVLEAKDGEARVMVNNIVGSAGDGEFVYDRLAGLVGMPPSTGG
jgi:hypothetical protein